jgi:hypothetical protein
VTELVISEQLWLTIRGVNNINYVTPGNMLPTDKCFFKKIFHGYDFISGILNKKHPQIQSNENEYPGRH